MRAKEKLKKIPFIVNLYEVIFGRLHKIIKKKHCYGDKNKDKTFFVISSHTKEMGIYSTIFYILPFIDYAIKKHYIPVIDLSRVHLPLLQDKDIDENPWEYYYEQPVKQYTLEEIYQSRHVIVMVDYVFKVKKPDWKDIFTADSAEYWHWNNIITSYIRINCELENRVVEKLEEIFKSNNKVLGVGVRAEYRAGMLKNEALYNNHFQQPSCEELLDIVEEKMREWGCDCIFLSCDDREHLNKFISRMGNKCYYVERRLAHFFKDNKPVLNMSEIVEEYVGSSVKERCEAYIIEAHILAHCSSLCSCRGGCTMFAYLLNSGQYENIEILGHGIYTGLTGER